MHSHTYCEEFTIIFATCLLHIQNVLNKKMVLSQAQRVCMKTVQKINYLYSAQDGEEKEIYALTTGLVKVTCSGRDEHRYVMKGSKENQRRGEGEGHNDTGHFRGQVRTVTNDLETDGSESLTGLPTFIQMAPRSRDGTHENPACMSCDGA